MKNFGGLKQSGVSKQEQESEYCQKTECESGQCKNQE